MADEAVGPARAPGLVWSWSDAALGAAYALPAAAVDISDVPHGAAFAVGVIPAAILGVAPTRRRRLAILVVGVLAGLSLLLGAILAAVPVLAVAALLLLGVGAALLAARARAGRVAMVLALPMVGIGFSFTDVGQAVGLAAVMAAGSAYACLVSLAWPERAEEQPPPPPPAARSPPPMLGYGLRLGAAGATAAAIGFALDFDHVGWACAAALLVMRPVAEMQRLRSVGRIVAVTLGAVLAIGFVRLDPAAGWYAAAILAVVAGATATHRSRWYVTAAFTTFLVFLLLLHADPADAGSRLAERVGETLLGVGIAYLFGLGLPALAARLPRRPSAGTLRRDASRERFQQGS